MKIYFVLFSVVGIVSERREITSDVYRLGINRYEHLEKALTETLMERHKPIEVASVFKYFQQKIPTPAFHIGP